MKFLWGSGDIPNIYNNVESAVCESAANRALLISNLTQQKTFNLLEDACLLHNLASKRVERILIHLANVKTYGKLYEASFNPWE